MKHFFIYVFLFAIPFAGFSQPKSSFDFLLSFDYSYRSINAEEDVPIAILEERHKETAKVNWRSGFNYNRQLGKQLMLKTGLRVASLGYKSRQGSALRFGSDHDGNGGFQEPDGGRTLDQYFDYWFLEIPAMLRFEFPGEKKISPFFEAGISGMYYLTTRNKTFIEGVGHSEYKKEPYLNDFQISTNLSFGINFSPNSEWQFFTQPVLRYHITQMTDAPIEEHLWSLGLEFGCRRSLN